MSAASRVTLGMAVTVSTAIIGYVHYKQSADRLRLHDGVLRDVEQQQRRKHENTYSLQQQIDITKQLKAKEASSNSPNTPIPPPITPSQGNLQAETDTNATQTPSSQEAELQQQGVEGSEEVLQAKAEAANQDAPSPPSDNI
ncbi:protein PET117 homolog, mitochondrial isoform X1 [Drosophila ficusphila]|uniref:protein PET117 homolog, mitochondrial isoform X1 n=1 Tax=Drosophila ficusphila TaxID=30025 RepID=UPI0007E68F2B|nr:protein PET117 homolog, mitochondrial isoform X1 [Drosophila ficusphila]